MNNDINDLASATGKLIKTIPELYNDAAQPTVKEVGKLANRIPRAINAAFSFLDKWILTKEYNVKETEKLLETKLVNVNPEKIVNPEPYVAIPALQAISYSMDCDELRNMYANLLAKSMYSITKESVHPAFVEVIKQMSPLDANTFKFFHDSKVNPIIHVKIVFDGTDERYFLFNVTLFPNHDYEEISSSINNLIRNGLIEIPPIIEYTKKSLYSSIIESETFIHFIEPIRNNLQHNQKIDYDKLTLRLTDFGKLFYKICIKDSILE